VATQLGGTTDSEEDEGAVNGQTVTNIILLTNYGNVSATFVFSFVEGNTNAAILTGAWTAGFGVGRTATVTTALLAPGADTTVLFVVDVTAGAGSGSARGYSIKASNEHVGAALWTNYTGDDSINYGGTMGDYGAGPKNVLFNDATGVTNGVSGGASASSTWAVTVSAPVISLTKTVDATDVIGAGITGIAVPGATITYKLTLTNTGTSVGTNLELADSINAAKVTLVAGALKTAGNVDSTYAAAGGSADGPGGDAAMVTPDVWFSPNGTTAGSGGTADGWLAATAGFSGFYRVTIR
jgi:uncharacterized repeat protein (TIGR01451 family)